MVTLNFTLLVELILYLIFLWGTARFILSPILRTIDAREESLEQAQVKTQADQAEAERLENEYARAIAETRAHADDTLRHRRHQAVQEHMIFIAEERQRADQTVAAVRMEAERAAEEARPQVLEAAPQLVESITQKLEGGRGS